MAMDIKELAERIEIADTFDAAWSHAVVKVLLDYTIADGLMQKPGERLSVEETIQLIDKLVPGWTIHITGTALEPDGHWQCHLRRSDTRDNDEFVGHGKGKHLQNALVVALLHTIDYMIGRKSLT
ncbi:hypothetical protein O2N63_01920 [Aliiroseovarius sp. KMU-50]|uniref:Uncharacterized protein n=1 Tax=Aliiroseovarius salicola TaxID=3009082 RepID=A0ABT4VX51_9RHOB|nr:hypothetical protein [Aliiroseovarius sp. KMU-50]MDA5092840.1 hypothetical protein [Aliiroseovarius sp. KMU-50]